MTCIYKLSSNIPELKPFYLQGLPIKDSMRTLFITISRSLTGAKSHGSQADIGNFYTAVSQSFVQHVGSVKKINKIYLYCASIPRVLISIRSLSLQDWSRAHGIAYNHKLHHDRHRLQTKVGYDIIKKNSTLSSTIHAFEIKNLAKITILLN